MKLDREPNTNERRKTSLLSVPRSNTRSRKLGYLVINKVHPNLHSHMTEIDEERAEIHFCLNTNHNLLNLYLR